MLNGWKASLRPQSSRNRERLSLQCRTPTIAFCAAIALLCASCATGAREQSEKKTPKEMAQLYTELGTQSLSRGDFPQAVQDLRKAIDSDSKNAIAHNHLGLAYYGLGEKILAKKELKEAISADDKYSDAYINLGNLALEENNSTLAKQYYNKALDNLEYKLRHRALTNLAQLAVRENNNDEAKRLLYQSLSVNPEYCLSHFLLGSILIKEENAKRAVEEFRKSIANTCASNIEGHYQLGLAYIKAKQFDKARAQFVHIVEDYPQTAYAKKAGEQLRNIP